VFTSASTSVANENPARATTTRSTVQLLHYSDSLLRRLRGRLGLQRQRVHAVFDLFVQERVHHPMPRDGELPAERLGHDLDVEVRLRVRIPGWVPGVPGVLEALVLLGSRAGRVGRGRRASAGDRRRDLAGRAVRTRATDDGDAP
jgi:hypothetical protein